MEQINLRGGRAVQQFQTNRIFRKQKNILVKLYGGDNKNLATQLKFRLLS